MATASIKIVLRKRTNKDGTRPIILQITKNRRSSIISTGQNIMECYWDGKKQQVKKTHPNSVRINNYLLKKLAEVNDNSLRLETLNKVITSKEIKQTIKPPAETLFFSQALLYLDDLKKANKYNQYTADKPRIKHFKEFLNNPDGCTNKNKLLTVNKKGKLKITNELRDTNYKNFLKDKDLPFINITAGLLDRFRVYLTGLGDKNQRTIMNHLAAIRSVFAYASKNKVIDKTSSPFGKEGVKIKFPDSLKIGLTPEEVKRLEEVDLPEDSFEEHTRKLWLFSFYFAGMRVSDVLRLKWSDLQNERLYYSMGKNAKGGSFKVSLKALNILRAYEKGKQRPHDFVFPDLNRVEDHSNKFIVDRAIAFTVSRIDKYLRNHVAPAAGIEKPLTMHIARHTFGNISGEKIPIQMLQKLYRHSHITTTIGYQANFIFSDADEALEAVIGS